MYFIYLFSFLKIFEIFLQNMKFYGFLSLWHLIWGLESQPRNQNDLSNFIWGLNKLYDIVVYSNILMNI